MKKKDDFTYSLVDSSSGLYFATLALPALQKEISNFKDHSALVAIGASDDGLPVGLVVARKSEDPDKAQAVLGSLAVLPGYRNRGIATQLLAHLETALTPGCQRVIATFSDRLPAGPALERALEKQGWGLPQPILRVFQGTAPDVADYPWLARAITPPAGFEIIRWAELTQTRVAEIKTNLRSDARYRGPFTGEIPEDFEPRTSLGLRYNAEVVGWCLTKSVANSQLLYYEGFFVRPDVRRFSRASLGLTLSSNVLYRHWQLREEFPYISFSVDLTNKHMLRFSHKYFEPFCKNIYQLKTTDKLLPAPTG